MRDMVKFSLQMEKNNRMLISIKVLMTWAHYSQA